ncbi:unnamed protein product [Amoebophrya sp. A120]|nr:unnamed protein product [Amoebophrya sp. A120]|eukprot:GSA120T00007090001.1
MSNLVRRLLEKLVLAPGRTSQRVWQSAPRGQLSKSSLSCSWSWVEVPDGNCLGYLAPNLWTSTSLFSALNIFYAAFLRSSTVCRNNHANDESNNGPPMFFPFPSLAAEIGSSTPENHFKNTDSPSAADFDNDDIKNDCGFLHVRNGNWRNTQGTLNPSLWKRYHRHGYWAQRRVFGHNEFAVKRRWKFHLVLGQGKRCQDYMLQRATKYCDQSYYRPLKNYCRW